MSHDLMTNYDACPTSSGCRCSIKFYKVLCDNNEIVAADMFQQLKRLLRPQVHGPIAGGRTSCCSRNRGATFYGLPASEALSSSAERELRICTGQHCHLTILTHVNFVPSNVIL